MKRVDLNVDLEHHPWSDGFRPVTLAIETVLEQRDQGILIDVRSPSEFLKGHIPGARNVPLLDDEERAVVGTTYRVSGRPAAIAAGLEIVKPKTHYLLQTVTTLAGSGKVILLCWRGGMRSTAVAWLLEKSGFQPAVLEGGYKAFRREVHACFERPRRVVILGGLTGAGKTRLLAELGRAGEQIIDLEGLARHRGSAFGGINELPQPTTEQFENDLFEQWRDLDPLRPVWLEDESRKIGSIPIPAGVWEQMRHAPGISLFVERSQRVEFLVQEYGQATTEELAAAAAKIQKRLGDQRFQLVLQALAEGRLHEVAGMLLEYYDKAYELAKGKHPRDFVVTVRLDHSAQVNSLPRLRQLANSQELLAKVC